MGFEEMLAKAFEIGSDVKFNVCIEGESEVMTY